jgi:hypothetical protein
MTKPLTKEEQDKKRAEARELADQSRTTDNPELRVLANVVDFYESTFQPEAKEVRVQIEMLIAKVESLEAERNELRNPKYWRTADCYNAVEEERDEARTEVKQLQEVRGRGCQCSDSDACQFAQERDEARAEVKQLKKCLFQMQEAAKLSTTEVERLKEEDTEKLEAWYKRDEWERKPENIDKTKHQLNSEWDIALKRLETLTFGQEKE